MKQTLNDTSRVTNLCVSQELALRFETSVPEKKNFPMVSFRPPLSSRRHGAFVLGTKIFILIHVLFYVVLYVNT
jgi:hypothetical protein